MGKSLKRATSYTTSALQAGGCGFDSRRDHQILPTVESGFGHKQAEKQQQTEEFDKKAEFERLRTELCRCRRGVEIPQT